MRHEYRQSPSKRATALAFLSAVVLAGVLILATRQRATFLFIDSGTTAGRLILLASVIGTALVATELGLRWLRHLPDVVVGESGVHVRRVLRTVHVPWPDLAGVQQGTWKAFAGSARPTVVLSRTNGRRLTLMPNYESVDADEFVADIIAAWAERR